ncbi:hypothetical protein [Calothrix sp. NIES-2098]|uniref:hypothetical protein n=1 Tax=Calothrix sp. NIES-2098 TaxID=1954171 RepID=UPI000B612A73|nr:hypothetical protein NIES2098_59040 [Calothrix sp. NIES-2098]
MIFKQAIILAAISIAISLANIDISVAKEARIHLLLSSQSRHLPNDLHDLNPAKNLDFSSVKLDKINVKIPYYQSQARFSLSLGINERKHYQCKKEKSFLLIDVYNLLARLLIVISFGSWGLGGYFSVIERYLKRIPKDFLIFIYIIFGLLSVLVISSAFLSKFAFAYPISNSSCAL